MPVLSCINLSQADLDELAVMAWQVITNAVKYQEFTLPAKPNNSNLEIKAATFVTLHLSGELKGCIGNYQPTESLWQSVCRHVYASAYEDYRFAALTENEIGKLTMELSLLSELSAVQNNGEQQLVEQLRPKVDGLLLSYKDSSAIFLPSVWRTLKSPRLFVKALKQKAGWPEYFWSKDIRVFIFNIQSYQLKNA